MINFVQIHLHGIKDKRYFSQLQLECLQNLSHIPFNPYGIQIQKTKNWIKVK